MLRGPFSTRTSSFLLIWILALFSSCAEKRETPAATDGEEETLNRTEFTNRIENFFEYVPLQSGKPSQFLIHLTDLNDGLPVSQAEVTLLARREGSEAVIARAIAQVGKVTGIYVAELAIPMAGNVDIEFHIRNSVIDEHMALSGFEVK